MERKLASGISGSPTKPEPGPAGDLDLGGYVPYLLHQAHRALLAIFEGDLAAHGVSLAEWRVLSVLHHRGPVRFGPLAGASGLEPPTLARVLAGLERRGLAGSRACENDRRRTEVSATAEGLALAGRIVPAARRLESRALAGCSAGEASLLRRLLRQLCANAAGADTAGPGPDATDD